MSRKIPIFYSALLLTAVNLLLRFAGTSFQVFLSSRIGAEGIGLLQLVMSVGSMALVAGMGGIRTATMYLTAEEAGRKHPENTTWILSGCILHSILCSGAVSVGIYFGAPYLANHWIGNPETVDSLRLFAAFLPVNCLTGVMVGFYTGENRIGTLAAVEVAEQICSMVCTILLLTLWAGQDAGRACMSVVLGSGISACLSMSCLVFLRICSRPPAGKRIPVTARLTRTALPLAIADDLRTGISTLEHMMVPKRLALYPGTVSALASFGIVSGMVFPILMFPVAILFGLTELLIPELARCSAAGSQKRIHYLVGKSLRVTLLYGAACGGIIFLNAESLCVSLYQNEEAGRYLRWFSLLAVMLYCDTVTDAMIKGLGQQKASVRYNIFTNILDIVFLYLLLPRYGIKGYFASFAITHGINYALSIYRLLKITGKRISLRTPVLTLAAAVAAVWISHFVPASIAKTATFLAVFFCLLSLCRIVGYRDLLWIRGLVRKTTENPSL